MNLPYMAFIMQRYVPSSPTLSKAFIGKLGCIFSKTFSALNQIRFFVLKPIYMTYYLTFIDHTHIFKIEPMVSELIIFYMCQYLVCKYFTDNWVSMFIQRYWPVVFILCVFLPRLDITVMLLHTKSLKVVFLHPFFNSLRSISCRFSLKVQLNSTVNPSGPVFSLVSWLFIIALLILFVMSLSC